VWKPSNNINNSNDKILVCGVLDGHGREVGKIAALAAKAALLQYFEESHGQLLVDPYDCLVKAHIVAHNNVKEAFRAEMIKEGYEVEDTPEGYLRRRKFAGNLWTCIHGGTSCSIIAIVGYDMFIANVGDSTGTLCTTQPVLSKSNIHHLGDSAVPPAITPDNVGSISINCDGMTDTLVVTAEHLPESPHEFVRIRAFKHRDGNVNQPSLVVCTPNSAMYSDALAFTRSLTDFHPGGTLGINGANEDSQRRADWINDINNKKLIKNIYKIYKTLDSLKTKVKTASGKKYRCFLTHNWGNKQSDGTFDNHERVKKIYRDLQRAGLLCWFDSDRMTGTMNKQMSRGIDDSDTVIGKPDIYYKYNY